MYGKSKQVVEKRKVGYTAGFTFTTLSTLLQNSKSIKIKLIVDVGEMHSINLEEHQFPIHKILNAFGIFKNEIDKRIVLSQYLENEFQVQGNLHYHSAPYQMGSLHCMFNNK